MTLVLLTGSDPFLSARAIDDTVRSWQKSEPDLGVEQISATVSNIRLRLAEASGEDLFGTRSILVVTDVDVIGDALDALLESAKTSPVIAHHRGGRSGQAALKELKKRADDTIECAPLKKGRALSEFVNNEFRRHKRRITSDALALLIEAVGTDLAAPITNTFLIATVNPPLFCCHSDPSAEGEESRLFRPRDPSVVLPQEVFGGRTPSG